MENTYVITKDGVVRKDDAVGEYVREISTHGDLEELIERIPYITTISAPNKKARRMLYDMAMEKYEDIEWVRIIKSVYLRMQDHRYEDYEPEYMEKAQKYLYGEISACYGIGFDEVEHFVCESVNRHMNEF